MLDHRIIGKFTLFLFLFLLYTVDFSVYDSWSSSWTHALMLPWDATCREEEDEEVYSWSTWKRWSISTLAKWEEWENSTVCLSVSVCSYISLIWWIHVQIKCLMRVRELKTEFTISLCHYTRSNIIALSPCFSRTLVNSHLPLASRCACYKDDQQKLLLRVSMDTLSPCTHAIAEVSLQEEKKETFFSLSFLTCIFSPLSHHLNQLLRELCVMYSLTKRRSARLQLYSGGMYWWTFDFEGKI